MSSPTSIASSVKLHDGNTMPLFGLGCWDMGDEETYNAVTCAIKEGYRMFDTAAWYGNEIPIGKALKDSGLHRSEYFVVTKLDPSCHGFEEAKNGFMSSYKKMDLEYIDLFLIHTPRPGRIVETWKALSELKKEGKTKSIGVSNFSGEHIKGLMSYGLEKPAVNQFEIHPLHQKQSEIQYCKESNIAVMGYCPLARGRFLRKGNVPEVDSIASKLNKTNAQIFLRWSVQNHFITIPKSSNAVRIKENAAIFDFSISEEDMQKLAVLDKGVDIDGSSAVMHNYSWEELKDADAKGMW